MTDGSVTGAQREFLICQFIFQSDFHIDLNQITLGDGFGLADPFRYQSHFELPDFNTDEIQNLFDQSDSSWLNDDILRLI